MDGRSFDNLARAASAAMGRRSAIGLALAGAAAASLTGFDLAGARRKGKKQKRCKKATQPCGGKKKCCKGLACTNGVCTCPAGTVASGSVCVPQPPAPECASDAQCGAGQVCQGEKCVPAPPECVRNADCGDRDFACVNGECVVRPDECQQDDDCGANEVCDAGPNRKTCICPDEEAGRCIQRCERQSDCVGACSCRNHFPEDSELIEDGICVKEPFFLCDATTCDGDSDCASHEICIGTSCGSNSVVFNCSPICVD